jgi:hypothetical protein
MNIMISQRVIRSQLSQMGAIYYTQDEFGIHTMCKSCKQNVTFGLVYHFQTEHPECYESITIMATLEGK